jgi:dihydroorotase-like cyclic amidohydrolase
MARLGNIMRVNPPIREPGHAEPLWQALRDGVIDMLATDHAPHTVPEKTDPNVWQCCCGFPGVETAVPLMLTEVAAGRLELSHYVRLASMNPAKAWGLFPRKGALQVGSDADIAIVDLAREGRVRADTLHSKSKITPFEGRPLRGLPVATLVRGRLVARDGALVGAPGWGRPIEPAMPAPTPRNADWTTAAIVRPPRF